jgi:hypothetical protein
LLGKVRAEKTDEFIPQSGNSKASPEAKRLIYTEKMAEAFASCEVYLEKSIAALEGGRGDPDNMMWHAAAELEYVLFLFSLKDTDKDVTLKWKTESHSRRDSTAKLLSSVQDLVVQSKETIAFGNWQQARRYAYSARNILLRIQREYSRKKRESSGSSSYSSST